MLCKNTRAGLPRKGAKRSDRVQMPRGVTEARQKKSKTSRKYGEAKTPVPVCRGMTVWKGRKIYSLSIYISTWKIDDIKIKRYNIG